MTDTETALNQAPVNLRLDDGFSVNIAENSAGGTLVGTLSASDPDDDAGSLHYELLDDAGGRFRISGNQVLVTDAADLDYEDPAIADQNHSHSIHVRVLDPDGESRTETFAVVLQNSNDAPTGSVTVSGTPTDGETLTADTSALADEDGLGAFSYQWLRDGEVITEANAQSYSLQPLDVGAEISVRVSYSDAGGTQENLTSDATSQITNAHGVIHVMPVGREIQINTDSWAQHYGVSIASLSDGGFVTTWQGGAQDGVGYGIFGQRQDASGATVGDVFEVSVSTRDNNTDPSTTGLADGGFVVTWQSDGRDNGFLGVYGQRYDANGDAAGNDFRINTTTRNEQSEPSVTAMSDGGFLVTWQSDGRVEGQYDVNGQRYDASGAAVGAEFLINTSTSSHLSSPSITAVSDGGFVVAWQSSDADGHGVFGQRYDAGGASIGAEFQINTHTDGDQRIPAIAGLSDGGFIVAWRSDGQNAGELGIYGQRYEANGTSVGPEFQISSSAYGSSMSITGLSDGGFVVTWAAAGPVWPVQNVFGQHYDASGAAVGTEFQINSFSGGDRHPAITELSNGSFVVAWRSNLDGVADGIYAQQFILTDNNAPTGNVIVSGIPLEDETLTSDASALADADGLGVFSYQWLRDGVDISGATASSYDLVQDDVRGHISVLVSYTDGVGMLENVTSDSSVAIINVNDAPTGSVTLSGTPTDGQTLSADTTALADEDGLGWFSYQWLRDGRVITEANAQSYTLQLFDVGAEISVWVSYTDAGGARENIVSDASPLIANAHGIIANGNEFRVNTTFEGERGNTYITGLTDGGFVVTWQADGQDGDSFGIFGQRHDASGARLGTEFQINTYTTSYQTAPYATGLSDGGFVVTWHSEGQDGDYLGIFGQRFDANGAAAGAEFRINTITSGEQSEPSVIAMPDGGFVVTWGGLDIYGQRYDASGASVGAEFMINTTTDGGQGSPSITALPDGGYVVTWQSNSGGELGVYGQRFDADGASIGAEFQINTYTTGHQWTPYITGLSGGGFVVIWKSDGQDASEGGIFGQRFDAYGRAVAAEFQVNSYTEGQQYTPTVAALANGGFVVTWTSDGHNGRGRDVYGQHYDASGATVGAEFRINSNTSGNQWIPSVTGLADGGFVVAWQSHGLINAQQFSLVDNHAPTGGVVFTGALIAGETLTADATALADADGLGALGYQWLRDGHEITGATATSYDLGQTDVGSEVSVRVGYTDGNGVTQSLISASAAVDAVGITRTGSRDVDRLVGGNGADHLHGLDGADTLIGGGGADTLIGGQSSHDLRDVIYGGEGDDIIDGGYGNDELRGDAGDDVIDGGFGGDRVIGGTGNDILGGGALGDELFGGDGFDFINGGWGHDRVNGGAGGDRFFHLGILDHGSDWIQDYNAAEGDVLMWGGGAATVADFQVNLAHTSDAGGERAGDDAVMEVFVIHRPTGQIIWALVDGGGQAEINLQIGGEVFDLLG